MLNGYIKVAAATPKIKVADCKYNTENIIKICDDAYKKGVKLIAFPELCVTGYTCSDLFLQDVLLISAINSMIQIKKYSSDKKMLIIIGLPLTIKNKLYNTAAVIYNGSILGIVPKTHLPNYSEFYEKRHFASAPDTNSDIIIDGQTIPFGTKQLFTCKNYPDFSFAIEICEDLWAVNPPSVQHAIAGAEIIVNLSASDDFIGKADYRKKLVENQSGRLICGYIYASTGDGESTTDLVFGGHNLICENSYTLKESKLFENGMILSEIDLSRLKYERRRNTTFPQANTDGYIINYFDIDINETQLTRYFDAHPFVPDNENERADRCESILTMQSTGLKKRLEHTNAKKAVIGISGGLDSTLALIVSVRAMEMLDRPHKDILAVTMPCFGTTKRTRTNAEILCEKLGVDFKCIDISQSVKQHFHDINHDENNLNVVYENCQARERTQVLMDIANAENGLVIGTGDLSELALGWATYNGDHMSMYAVNASVPKTLVRHIVKYYADVTKDSLLKKALYDILDTPVSPELLPPENGSISQKTEDIVGPYELHDFYLYNIIRCGYSPKKVYRIAQIAFKDKYNNETLYKWLKNFYRRFFSQQFKRSCIPDGPKVGSVTLSPRGDFRMPSDASVALWMDELENLKEGI